MTLTFNELRRIKDNLPDGTMRQMAEELGMNVDTVRNFFGGFHFEKGDSVGIHIEPGPDGGAVALDEDGTRIVDLARKILKETEGVVEEK
ncbi:MAG: DNA-binding protein [Bacteroidetes bacterium]|nr:MAG: DNA-binding protein [Bacteroidota bacterium]